MNRNELIIDKVSVLSCKKKLRTPYPGHQSSLGSDARGTRSEWRWASLQPAVGLELQQTEIDKNGLACTAVAACSAC